MNSIKILAIRFNIRLKTASNRKNNTSLTSQAQKVVKVKTLVLEFMLGHVFFCYGDLIAKKSIPYELL